MKYCILLMPALLVWLSGPSSAQQSNTSEAYSVDVNGNRVPYGPEIMQTKSDGNSTLTVSHQSINGGSAPLERVEERVLKNDASERIVERVTQRYDPQGNPLPPEKETIDEQKHPDGSSTTQSTTSRTDINGNLQVIEKTTTDTQLTSSGKTSQTVVERPSADGLRTVERREEVVVQQPSGYQSDSTTYRSDGNGGFQVAVRQTDEHTVNGAESSDNSAEYEIGPTGQLQLHTQTVTKTVTQPDGLKNSVVDIYSRDVPGTVNSPDSSLKLQEQQTISAAPGPNNTVVQTLSVRRPTVSSPGTLGPEQQISQTVCQGDCKPQKAGP
ncbi:MAG TPA: hypothetical protein VME17_04555 [Bryobacteraceae bacterium]|nr:hypothetical protein [Bryobacteraceae bacterium]